MPHFPELNEAPYETTHEVLSSSRPPQLNETVCGYRCRCGCGCGCGDLTDGEAGGTEEDNVSFEGSTHVGHDEDDLPSSDRPESNTGTDMFAVRRLRNWDNMGRSVIATRYGGFLHDDDGFRLDPGLLRIEDQPRFLYPPAPSTEMDMTADSIDNENASDGRSIAITEARSVRAMSPGPGMGPWAGDVVQSHFLVKPLRLTPQRRFCRGLVASHLIVRDDTPAVETAQNFFVHEPARGRLFG